MSSENLVVNENPKLYPWQYIQNEISSKEFYDLLLEIFNTNGRISKIDIILS